MYTIGVLIFVLGAVSADIGLGYHYKVPPTSYGVPTYQVGGSSGQYNTGYTGSSSFGSNYKVPTTTQGGYQGSAHGQGSSYQTEFGNTGYQTGGALHSGSGLSSGNYYQSSGLTSSGANIAQPAYQLGGDIHTFNQYQTSSQYQTSTEKYQQYYQVQQQPAEVYKHFYVHAAPEEPELPKPRQPIVLPPPQKHYKIIFVKTPTQTRSSQVIQVPQQNEEKTIVYVLVNKPEEQHDVIVPKVEQKPPSKPEVYFIKYNNKEDSQSVINNIVNDYNNKGDTVNFLNSGVSSGVAPSTGLTGIYDASGVLPIQTTSDSTSHLASQASTSSFGSSSLGVGGGSLTVLSTDSGSVSGGLDNSNTSSLASNSSTDTLASGVASTGSVSSSASSSNYDGASTISTSQGVPHETYGPPKFRS